MPHCDLTKSISLPKKQRKRYTLLRILMVILFLAGISYFLSTLFFPTAYFSYDDTIDSLANTIKEPRTKDDITSFDVALSGTHDRAKIVINTEEDLAGKNILMRKSFAAFLSPITTLSLPKHAESFENNGIYYLEDDTIIYPLVSYQAAQSYLRNNATLERKVLSQSSEISSQTRGFSSGSLLSSNSGIYVIDGIKKHAIDDEETFLALGYNFDDVIKTDSEERGAHQKAKIYTISATHPTNTFFTATDTDTTFHYDGTNLRTVDVNTISHKPITVDFEDRNESAECILSASVFSQHRYTCSVSLEAITDNAGNIYRFSLPGTSSITGISTALAASPTRSTIDRRIKEMKKILKEQFK